MRPWTSNDVMDRITTRVMFAHCFADESFCKYISGFLSHISLFVTFVVPFCISCPSLLAPLKGALSWKSYILAHEMLDRRQMRSPPNQSASERKDFLKPIHSLDDFHVLYSLTWEGRSTGAAVIIDYHHHHDSSPPDSRLLPLPPEQGCANG